MKTFWTLLFALIVSKTSGADVDLGSGSKARLATVEEGQKVLMAHDDFIERLSLFDRAARLKTDQNVSEKEFLAFVGSNVMAFTAKEGGAVEKALGLVAVRAESFKLSFPKLVLVIKTTGKEEGEAAYTRGNAIVIPAAKLKPGGSEPIEDLLCHELFHVLSRNNPALKEKLYAAIGFHKCNEAPFPPRLMRITNPDAPKNDHWIRVKSKNEEALAVPILFASPSAYDTTKGGEFFNYLRFKLLVVKTNESNAITYPVEQPVLLDVAGVKGFFEQVGFNTQYIIHPEEILADNFVLLVNGKSNVKSPEILAKMKEAVTSVSR